MHAFGGPGPRAWYGRSLALTVCLALAVGCTEAASTLSPTRSTTTAPTVAATSPSPDLSAAGSLEDAVTVAAILGHLREFERIADENDGNRAAGTPGHEATLAYVEEQLRDAGLDVEEQDFEFPEFELTGPSELGVGPGSGGGSAETFQEDRDFKPLLYSAAGGVDAYVTAVGFDPSAPPGDRSGGGCLSADFADFPVGNMALVQPGNCFRRDQLENAQAAGASAMFIAYPGTQPDHVLRPTLLGPVGVSIPAVSVSADVASALVASSASGELVHVVVRARSVTATTTNLLAETPGGDPSQVLMVGGHLDSVIDGPGINDNGSGTATILEVARQISALGLQLDAKVRFAFWSGEELGLLGSDQYVSTLQPTDQQAIIGYLNFDMLGSTNFVREVYQEDGAPSGSADLTQLFLNYFEDVGIGAEPASLGGGSDHGSFMRAGIPIGGLFTGASEVMTSEQAATFGGQAGEPQDACYHLACDRVDRLNVEVLDQMADAVAFAVVALAS
jgi:Zn-dependent M28 family amino/carboxypeptidase